MSELVGQSVGLEVLSGCMSFRSDRLGATLLIFYGFLRCIGGLFVALLVGWLSGYLLVLHSSQSNIFGICFHEAADLGCRFLASPASPSQPITILRSY